MGIKPTNTQRTRVILLAASRVSGRWPVARLEKAAAPSAPNRYAQPGVLLAIRKVTAEPRFYRGLDELLGLS